MSKKKVPYDMINYFLHRDKTLFFLGLADTQNRKKKIYDIRTELRITEQHSRMILNSLKYYKLIDFKYDLKFNSYVVEYTERGLRLRKKLVDFESTLKRIGIWEDKK